MERDDFSWNNGIKCNEKFGKIVSKSVFEEKKYPESFGRVAIPISEKKENVAADHTMVNDIQALHDEEIGDGMIDNFKECMRVMLPDQRHSKNH